MVKKHTYFDYSLLFVIFFLMAFGLLMLYSASYANASVQFLDGAYFLKNQLKAMILGTVGMVIMIFFPYKWLEKLSFLIYLLSFALCVAVIFVGTDHNGSKRWLEIGPIQFQPSEVSKILVVIYLANRLSANAHKIRTFKDSIVIVLPTVPIIALIVTQNLSTALVVCSMIGVMLFVVSPKMKELMLTAGGGIILLFVYLLTANSYRNERVQIWLHPESHKKGFQTMQALYAIGSGGIFGKGLGQSMQKMGFIPESHNDMIFSIICEELGLFGAVCLILVFVALIFRMLLIALNTEDLFGSLIVIGFMTHIAIQVFINIAVVTNTIPPTGIPLPFISYGGTSILVVMIEMGIVLSISKKIHIR